MARHVEPVTRVIDESARPQHVSDHLANERTHLAYVRTSIALMGFGITLNRFSLFLLQSKEGEHSRHHVLIDAQHVGVGMALFGLGLLLLATIRYALVDRAIDRGTFHPNRVMVWLISLVLLGLGAWSIVWLFAE
jgi:putative membrane protein